MEILTRGQVAELLQVNRRTIDYWVSSQQIPHSRLGKRLVRFQKDEIRAWLKDRSMVEYHHGAGAS